MIMLLPYDESFERVTLRRIGTFFGFHDSLIEAESMPSDDIYLTLTEWQTHPNALYMIIRDGVSLGFMRIGFRGPSVAWIEDIFVDVEHRGQGIASDAIATAERIVAEMPGYTAVCMDVSPRNENALRLYHKLGYTDLSLITVRKELGKSKRDQPITLLGLNFRY